ncbi:hypothetical protein [Solwaraspora sp. WMMD792]|uniref:magnesium transporter MgtE N-terminal domain-containing protein n=1 Tax=Solwaraspora sp. WMMD792 TaxID=3016099 RepID=UPI002416626A|nr:hypothetical protein [Solwaraspora sp. WMMD792]MDG4771171.1 hypothetical protein [Solwaraspora sp. WMMD792]
MNASADGQGQVFQAGRDIVISGEPHANARKLTVLNVAAAAQVLTEMAASADTRDEAVVIVADMDPEVARLRLQAMPPESAGQILARMDHQLAYERLVRIPDTQAAAILSHMPAEPAAELVVQHSQESKLRLLSEMEPQRTAQILMTFADVAAARLAVDLSRRGTGRWNAAAMFAAIPADRLIRFMVELEFSSWVELLEAMSAETVENLISFFPSSYAAKWLTAISAGKAARVIAVSDLSNFSELLGGMSDDVLVERASDLLAEVEDISLTRLFRRMPARRACHVVAGLPADRAAHALMGLWEGRIAVLLALVTQEHAESILQQIPGEKRRRVEELLA